MVRGRRWRNEEEEEKKGSEGREKFLRKWR